MTVGLKDHFSGVAQREGAWGPAWRERESTWKLTVRAGRIASTASQKESTP